MDQNLFFKEATLRICGSLDIDVALWRLREWIAQYMPADEIYLNIYEPALGGLKYVAKATEAGGVKLEKSIQLSEDLIQTIESGRRLQDHLILNNPEQDAIGRIIVRELGLDKVSLMAFRLKIEGRRLGVMDLFAYGKNRYNGDHARLLSLLREPVAIAMSNALRHQETVALKEQLLSDNRDLNIELISKSGGEMVGARAGLKGVMDKIAQIAHLKNTILILGETGVGKEVVANEIHRQSSRRNEPFIKVDCGAIPENLIDSELFGHEKGAFTGAVKQKRGRFERAHKGTLFLDEIGELPPWAQVRLLRVLQTQEIERVGGSVPIKLDIRVIAATHRDLEQMIKKGAFREDLWFRVNAFPLTIPPLRQRKEDIQLLTRHFIGKKSLELGLDTAPHIDPSAMDRLVNHDWPGNVRELENVIERALIQHRHGPLFFNQLVQRRAGKEISIPLQNEIQLLTLDEVVKSYIKEVLAITRGQINGDKGAATILGVHPNTLRNRMKKLGIPFGRNYQN